MSRIEDFGAAVTFSWCVYIKLLSVLMFIVSARSPNPSASNDSKNPEILYNLLAPPHYALRVWFLVVINCFSSMLHLRLLRCPRSLGAFFLRMMDRPYYLILVFFITGVAFFLLIMVLEGFLLHSRFRLFLAPIALVFMWWCGFYAVKEEELQQTPCHATELIEFALSKLCIHLAFIWLAGTIIFSVIDIAQFYHGNYFSFDAYAKLMGFLIAFVIGVYTHTQDPVVPWIATWFIVGLANRKNRYEGETKETFEMLQTAAIVVTPIFAVVLCIDTVEGLYQYLHKFKIHNDSSSESDEHLNTAYGSM